MGGILPELEVRDAREWRDWLERQHATSAGVWLVFLKGKAGCTALQYEDAVREALCFGWIDSLVRRLDDARYVRKFTPRRAGSSWSDSNRKRWAELHAAGRLAPAGLLASPADDPYAPRPDYSDVPQDIRIVLQQDAAALHFFEALAPTYRNQFVGWIEAAKRPATRERRLREALALLAAGRRLGLK